MSDVPQITLKTSEVVEQFRNMLKGDSILKSSEIAKQLQDMISGSLNSISIYKLNAIHVEVKREDDLIVVVLLSGGKDVGHGIAFTTRSDVMVQLLTQLVCALLRLKSDPDALAQLENLDEPITATFKPGEYLKSDASFWVVGKP